VKPSSIILLFFCLTISCKQKNEKTKQDSVSITNKDEHIGWKSIFEQKLSGVDSVILISHLTNQATSDDSGKYIPAIPLVKNNKLNTKLIKEQYRLNEIEIDSLLKIFTKGNNGILDTPYVCFSPHQAVLIYKNSTCSYVDICFFCKGMVTSDDINLPESMSESSWDRLKHFFYSRGLTYSLVKEKT
jgi:hypothetical protein